MPEICPKSPASNHIDPAIDVSFIFRHSTREHQYFSIERLFNDVSANLPSRFKARIYRCRVFSQGLLRRFFIAIESALAQGEVTHVTGDIHFAVALMRRKTTVLTIHDLHWVNNCKGITRWFRWFTWVWLPVNRAAVVTVISEATKRELLRRCNVDERKIRVVPNCVSLAFTPHPRPFQDARPTVLQVGTKDNKNLERVIMALEGLTCHLRIIGLMTREQRALLESRRIDYSNVAALSDAEIVDEYRRADVLAFVSLAEGFGLPIIEAQATGRVVVTSNISPMTDVAGDGAIFVDPLDTSSIRQGLKRVFDDASLRERLVAAGLANVTRFSASSIAEQYGDIYKELAVASRRRANSMA